MFPPLKVLLRRTVILAVVTAAMGAWVWWTWYYTPSFPLGVHFELEVDSRPVVLHQLVDCIRTQTYAGGIGHKAQHSFLPFPTAIGTELPDGSSVLAIVPTSICAMWRHWPDQNQYRGRLLPFQPVPEFVPVLAWAEAGMPPPRIDMFLSREAVTRPDAKVRFKTLRLFHPHDEDAGRDTRFEWFLEPDIRRFSKPPQGQKRRFVTYEGFWALEVPYNSDTEAVVEAGATNRIHLADAAALTALERNLRQLDESTGTVDADGSAFPERTRRGESLPDSPAADGERSKRTNNIMSKIRQFIRLPGEPGVYVLRQDQQGTLSLYPTDKVVRYGPAPESLRIKIGEVLFPTDHTGRTTIISPDDNKAWMVRYQRDIFAF